MEKRLVPELRFPEFGGEWEEKRLGNLLEFKNGINASKEQYGKGIKFINVLDILQNNFITYENILGKVDVDDKIFQNYEVNYGDVLFQRSSETREEVGKANVYLDSKPATFGGFVIRGKKISDYDPIFLKLVLDCPYTRREIMSRSGGSTRYNVSQQILSEASVVLPKMKEQTKIAKLFTSIDNKIEKQEEKVINLEEYKNGMMQKVFSQEMRFKDENGEDYPKWEEKCLGQIAIVKTGSTPPTKDITNYGGTYLFVSPGDLGKQKYIMNTEKKLSQEGFLKSRRFVEGSILFTCIGSTIGKIGLAKVDLTSNQQINAILPNSNYSSEYLYYILSYLADRIKSLAANQAVPIINKTDFEQALILIPCLLEQEKIANFLSSFDSKIEKENEKLDSLKELKKGLMQKMFV